MYDSGVGTCTSDTEDRLAELSGMANVVAARMVALCAEVLASKEWAGPGIRSAAHWLAWRSGVSVGHARQIVAVARRRDEFPRVIAAFERGELTLHQVEAVVTGAPAWADAQVVYMATQCTVAQLKKIMRDRFFDDGTPDQPDEAARPENRLSTSHTDQGRWRINGEADPEAGAIIDQALDEARDALFRAGQTDVTNIDALVEIAKRSLGSIASKSRRERYKINLYLDAEAHLTTIDGWKLPDSLAQQLLCNDEITPVWTRQGIPFNQGRATRAVPPHLRAAILRRDRGSRCPWETDTKHLEIHHIRFWIPDGVTDTDNLIAISTRLHRAIHNGDITVDGNADHPNGLTWRDRHGRILDTTGQPIPPTQLPIPESKYEPPCGQHLDMNYIGWTHIDLLSPHAAANLRHRLNL
jgi:hypothetical protein